MSAPESVRTKDGITWTLRTVTSSGIALYAPKGVCECPAFVMATLAELAEHGIQSAELAAAVAEHGAFPMPVGPVPPVDADRAKAPWGRDEAGRPLLGPGAHWTDVPEVVDQELARIQGRVDQAQSGHWYVASDTEAWRPAGTVRTNVDGYQRTVGQCTNMRPADLELVLHAHDDLSWCLEMLAKSRARVAELEHTVQQMVEGLNGHDCPPPDETPMQAVTRFAVRLMEAERLLAEDGCSCPPADHPHQVGCPLDLPAPGSERPVNELTATFAPVAALREALSREEPHDSPLHQAHRLGHDLDMPGEVDPGDRLLGGDELRRAVRGHLFGGGS